jgi:hypothetical protein
MATAKETSAEDNIEVTNERATKTSQEVDLEKAGLRPDLERKHEDMDHFSGINLGFDITFWCKHVSSGA